MKGSYVDQVNRTSKELSLTFEEAQRYLALSRCQNIGGKKASTAYEIINQLKRSDFTIAMVNYNTKHTQNEVVSVPAAEQQPAPTEVKTTKDAAAAKQVI